MPSERKPLRFVSLQSEMRKRMQELRQSKPELYSTGLNSLDTRLRGGVAPGEMVVVGAATSHGKTLFGMQFSYEISSAGAAVLVVSEEMTPRTLAERGILSATETEQSEWGGNYWESVFDDVIAWEESHAGQILIPEIPCHSTTRTVEAIEQAVAHFHIRAVVVDYLQLLTAAGQSRYEQVSNVSRALKQAAVEFNIVVIALAQLNRTVDKEAKGVPAIWHLSDSGQIERDADVILLLQWPHRTNREYQPANEYRIIVGKNRNRGIHGDNAIELRIEPMRQRIVEKEITEHRNYRPEFAGEPF
jgi:replicative DNA helicase